MTFFILVSGVPTVTTLVYSETTRSLTCTSTGGPATTVTWRKDGANIAIDGTTYQQTQVVTDTATGTYQTVLKTDQSVTDVFGTYSCTVGNTRGTSTAFEATGDNFFIIPAAVICTIGQVMFMRTLAIFAVSRPLPITGL